MNGKYGMLKKFCVSFIVLTIIATILQYYIINKSNANAYYSYDIEAIDESKYPGYKTALRDIKKRHPNWKIKLYYTGLDWKTVIDNENTGHHTKSPKNLVQDIYDGEWICPICQETRYDVSQHWYCASREALKFMMDPRNAFQDNLIFQFQDLTSSVGDREAVKKATEGTFLHNSESYIDAIIEAAQKHSVSPFHIISRILVEQGNDGRGVFAKGYDYEVEENGKKKIVTVYNAFNINVTGGAGEYESGARKAYEEKWFSLESSIIGGAKFIKNEYFKRGQVTQYFQKYNVIEPGNLYNHQYMQNIEAARTEGRKMYNGYKKNGIENSSFEFIIPIYNNMPQYASYKPNESYMGQVNTELKNIELIDSNGSKYISGNIDIAEWINDECYKPKGDPIIYLKSTDGTINKKMYSYYKEGITYYYDTRVENLDASKQYYMEVRLNSPRNAGTQEMKIQRVRLPNKEMGKTKIGTLRIQDNLLRFNYIGVIGTKVNEVELIKNQNKDFIKGTVDVTENISGNISNPGDDVEFRLKSTDGEINKKMFMYKQAGNTYYFDTTINEIDYSKQYYIEAKLINKENKATEEQKTSKLLLTDKALGKTLEGNEIRIENNKFKFKYVATIIPELINIEMGVNQKDEHYIFGNINIKEKFKENINIPNMLPELLVKTSDGYVQKMYVNHSGDGAYYFDTYIENLNKDKEYYIEARLSNNDNIASEKEKSKVVNMQEKQLGIIKEHKVFINENKIKFVNKNIYEGKINTKLLDGIYLNDNGKGKHYISGNVEIKEQIDGKMSTPKQLPSLELKTSDGYVQKMYVNHSGEGKYYFDTYVEDIDLNKEYYIEAKLTDKNNIAKQKAKILELPNGELGRIKDNKVVVKILNNKLIFK